MLVAVQVVVVMFGEIGGLDVEFLMWAVFLSSEYQGRDRIFWYVIGRTDILYQRD